MKVVSYNKVIPAKNTNKEKNAIIEKFIQGVRKSGRDIGIVNNTFQYEDCDVAVIQGWQHSIGKHAPHLRLRQDIIDTQLSTNRKVIVADSNLFLYANPSNTPHHYLRYSINGVFPTTGEYCDDIIDTKRWDQIKKDCNISVNPVVKKGRHILLCCQRNGGWSMGSYDVITWIMNTVTQIRKHSDRPIVIRAHPGDKKAIKYMDKSLFRRLPGVTLSAFDRPLHQDLYKCWAVVNHNSSSIVGPIIQGYHSFITDSTKSQCADVSHIGFEHIENPMKFDRQAWLRRISMFHWKFSELEDGTCWNHMRDYCQ